MPVDNPRLIPHPLIVPRRRRHEEPHPKSLPTIWPFGKRYPKIGVGLARILHIGNVSKEDRLRRILYRGISDGWACLRIHVLREYAQLIEVHPDPEPIAQEDAGLDLRHV